MRILSFEAENIKRLKAVEITPDGNMVIVGGKNEQGKTSTLDGIEMTIGGARSIPREPIRRGEQHAYCQTVLGEDDRPVVTVRREFTGDGKSRLVARGINGEKYSQTALDSLVGDLSFDPLAFSKMKAPEQTALLMSLVGLDFTKLNAKRQGFYDERTVVGREVKSLEGQLKGLVEHADAPEQEVSVVELAAQLDAINEAARTKDAAAETERKAKQSEFEAQEEVERLKRELKEAEQTLADRKTECLHAKLANDGTPDPGDPEPIRAQMNSAEEQNTKVRENARRREVAENLKTKQEEYSGHTAKIEAIDLEKHHVIEAAKFPVAGLGFDEDGVTYQGLPFDQASAAARLKVSVAIGMALNPTLKILLIRDGNTLDSENLKLVAQMAEEAGGQVWLERVSDTGDGCTVVIEDGMVKGAPDESAGNAA